MRKLFRLIFFLIAGLFCACHRGQESSTITLYPEGSGIPTFTPEATIMMLPENTKKPSQDPALTKEPLPTPVSGQEEGQIPIDEEHFISAVFREYIYENYDNNRDKMLSREEREAVREIDLQSFGDMRFIDETLNGFENFPCLEEVYLGFTGKVIIQGHPAMRFFGGTENAIYDMIIVDCPVLEKIGFYLSDLGNVSVKNCPELKEFSVENGDINTSGAVWEFSGTPQLVFDSDVAPDRLVLDADVALKAYYGSFEPEFFTFNEEQQLCYCGTEVEWINLSEINIPASVSPEIERRLEEKASQMYKLVTVLDSRFHSTVEGRESNRLILLKRASEEEASVYVRFYSKKEQLGLEDFSFSYNGKTVIDEYSPNRAITQHWEGWIFLIYEEDGKKQEVSKWKVRTGPVVLFADGSTKEYELWEQWLGRDKSRD